MSESEQQQSRSISVDKRDGLTISFNHCFVVKIRLMYRVIFYNSERQLNTQLVPHSPKLQDLINDSLLDNHGDTFAM